MRLFSFESDIRTISSGSGAFGLFASFLGVFALFSFLSCHYIAPLPKILASRLVARFILKQLFLNSPPHGSVEYSPPSTSIQGITVKYLSNKRFSLIKSLSGVY